MKSILVAVALCACGDNSSSTPGPFDGIPVSTTVTAPGLSAPVDVVRDACLAALAT